MAFAGDSIYWIEVDKIVENPYQPRREFDEHKLRELAESVRMYGILQPLTVTRREIQREDGTFYTEYELIAGERRLRASKLAGLAQVPVTIRDGEESEQEKLELAIIENLQREDLNAVDRAMAFHQLAETFGLSHSQVAKKVGRSREYVSNTIRLLGHPEPILNALRVGDISEGHARTLLMLSDKPEEQDVVFREILLKKLSVRETERISRKIATDKIRKRDPNDFDEALIEMEKRFTETLGTRVQIQKTDFGGRLTIDYFSVDDLESMLARMRDEERQRLVDAGADVADTPAALALSASTPLSFASANERESVSEAPVAPPPLHDATPPEPTKDQLQPARAPADDSMPSVSESVPPSVAPEKTVAEAAADTDRVVSNPPPPAPTPTSVAEPTPAVTQSQGSSRDLASALRAVLERRPTAPSTPAPAPTAASHVSEAKAPQSEEVVEADPQTAPTTPAEPSPQPSKPSAAIEDDLYSIRNFTI